MPEPNESEGLTPYPGLRTRYGDDYGIGDSTPVYDKRKADALLAEKDQIIDVADELVRDRDRTASKQAKQIAALEAKLARAVGLVLSAEWRAVQGYEGEYSACPWCGGMEPDGIDRKEFKYWHKRYGAWYGHTPDCPARESLAQEGDDGN